MSAPDIAAQSGELAHFVSTEPFDPVSATRLTPEQERFYLRVAVAADVVEVQAAPRRRRLGRRSCC